MLNDLAFRFSVACHIAAGKDRRTFSGAVCHSMTRLTVDPADFAGTVGSSVAPSATISTTLVASRRVWRNVKAVDSRMAGIAAGVSHPLTAPGDAGWLTITGL